MDVEVVHDQVNGLGFRGAPEGSGGGAGRGSTGFRSAAGCSSAYPFGDRLPRRLLGLYHDSTLGAFPVVGGQRIAPILTGDYLFCQSAKPADVLAELVADAVAVPPRRALRVPKSLSMPPFTPFSRTLFRIRLVCRQDIPIFSAPSFSVIFPASTKPIITNLCNCL